MQGTLGEVNDLRIHHFSLMFLIIVIPILFCTEIAMSERFELAERQRTVHSALVMNVCDAVSFLGDEVSSEKRRDETVEAFMAGLSASLGVLDSASERSLLRGSIPLIMFFDSGYAYLLKLLDEEGGVRYGWERVLRTSGEITERAETLIRSNRAVLGCSEGEVGLFLDEENGSELMRAIESNTMLVVYCDRTVSASAGEGTILAGAGFNNRRIRMFEVDRDESGLVYHRDRCSLRDEERKYAVCYTKKECADLGAYPCRECFGDY